MKPFFIPLVLTSSLVMLTTTASAENLLQVYSHAKAYDPQLKAFEENFLAVKESINQANAALKPQVGLSASSTLSNQHTYNSAASDGSTDIFSNSYSVNLTKPLYNKSLKAVTAKAQAAVAQSGASLENSKQDLIIRTAESYFNILLNKENLTFAQAEKKAIGKQLEQVKAHFEAGIVAITDVKETQSRYDQSGAQVISSSNQLELAKEALRVITGRSYKQFSGNGGGIKLVKPNPANIDTWINLAEKKNKQIQASKHAIQVAQKNLEQQRAGRKPTVDLVASHGGTLSRYGSSSSNNDQINTAVGVQLNIPLYTGGATSSNTRDALHRVKQAQHELTLQQQLIQQQVSSAYLTVISDISRTQSLQQALNSTQTALEATQAGFEVGTRTAVDVLLSLRNVFAAKRDFASARYNYLLNTLKLKQAAGTISVNDIKQATALLGK